MKDQITQAFSGCKNILCNCNNKEPFETYTISSFYVYDEEGGISQQPVRVVSKEQSFQLTVINPANKTIVLGKLDKCLFDDAVSKCDCVLYDDEQLFFVEIKTSSLGSKANKRRTAVAQLKQTLLLFKSKGVLDESLKTMALICFKTKEPRIIQSSLNSAAAFFLEETGIRLAEGNTIEFT